MRLTKLPKWHPVISLMLIFSKLQDDRIPDLWLRDHPFREFFIGGVQERFHQKGRTLILLKSQSPSLFPLINFLFLPDCLARSLFLCTHLTDSRDFSLLNMGQEPYRCKTVKFLKNAFIFFFFNFTLQYCIGFAIY